MSALVKYSCQTLALLLREHGVKHAVLSPGSRNAPLLMALHGSLATYSVVDERSAAFMALGMARTLEEPVALVCTSGSALLNYAPAIAEAFYSHVPLVVVSADRPHQWIDQDDSQTIRQPGALGNIVKYGCDIADYTDPDSEQAWYAARCINDALLSSCAPAPGPVHINMQLDEPLTAPWPELTEVKTIFDMRFPAFAPDEDYLNLAHTIKKFKIMVVAGFMNPNEELSAALRRMAELPNVIVMAESTANIRCPGAVNTIDRILSLVPDDDDAFRPQLVISMGGALISRHLKNYLRRCSVMHHWSVGHADVSADVFQHLTMRVQASPERFLPPLAEALAMQDIESDYRARWVELRGADRLRHELQVSRAPWSSLRMFALLWPRIPAGSSVHLSNGTCVRYAQLFYNPAIKSCFSNRGVSGIDGCTSTAVGAAIAAPTDLTLLISGDMSFAYDLNALQLPALQNLRIIVVNNKGGGIFRFISSTRDIAHREQLVAVDPALNICAVAKNMGYCTYRASGEQAFLEQLFDFFSGPGPALLEVAVDPDKDADAIKQYFS